MEQPLANVKAGIAIVMICLLFGLAMGIGFGVNEDFFKDFIANGIAANPDVHDAKSQDKIWRYAQRSHFHATGIAAFTAALVLLTAFSSMTRSMKRLTAVLVALGGVYPMAWFSMFILSPSMGRSAAHAHIITELFTYVGVGCLLLGLAMLIANLFLGLFSEQSHQ